MRIDIRRFLRALLVLVALNGIAFSVVFVPRPALTEEQWTYFEAQRPKPFVPGAAMEMSMCADCLNFAVFRRGIGGWESFSAKMLQLANLPAFLVANAVFSARQARPSGTSKDNSDIASAVLVAVALMQCALLAFPISIGVRRTSRAV